MKQIIFMMIVFGFTFDGSDAFSECVINGNTYANDAPNPNNGCLVCNEVVDATAWSPRDCSAVEDVCVIGVCVLDQDNKPACQPRVLPKFARCSDAVCADGAISQGECTDANPPECVVIEKNTCDGFACLNTTECAVQCSVPADCRNNYVCTNNVCEPPSNPDMGTDGGQDVGADIRVEIDSGTPDSGVDTGVNSDSGLEDSGGPVPIIESGGGCCATTAQKFNPSVLVFVLFCLVLRRRRLQ